MRPRAVLTYGDRPKAEPYADALRDAGMEPVLICAEAPHGLAGLGGLVLSGGKDLDPASYGATPDPHNDPPDPARDQLETSLVAEALAADLPVLAICRGMQLFNVAQGGTLIQHLDNCAVHRVKGLDLAEPVHQIVVEPATRLAAILGAGVHAVNSRHHQAVGRVGAGLRVAARSVGDDVIEALERADRRFALAVQWHPEDQVRRDREQRKLFEALAEAIAGADDSARS